VKKGQSVIQAAQKLAERHLRKSLANAVNPISEEIKQYLSSLVEADVPERATLNFNV
jgi:3-methyladenine DNA glycosylase AlkC